MVVPIGQPEPYERFRGGVSFQEAVAELRREAAQAWEHEGRRMFWRRSTVLGRMRQRKQEAYEAYRNWFRPDLPEWARESYP